MGKIFLKFFICHLCIFKMISVSWGSFEVCMLGYPPAPRRARRLTAQPANPRGLGQPRGGGSPRPPLQTPTRLHTPRGHTLACSRPRSANVAVYYCYARVQLGSESWVIAPNGVHRACTMCPFPLCWGFRSPLPRPPWEPVYGLLRVQLENRWECGETDCIFSVFPA